MPNDLTVRLDKRKLDQLIQQSPQRAGVALRALALEGERIWKESFNTSPAGRRYRRGTRIHIASRGGYPPNIDTGKLMNAIYVYKRATLQQVISSGDTEYAVPLEFGTSKMDARPAARPMALELGERSAEFFDGYLER